MYDSIDIGEIKNKMTPGTIIDIRDKYEFLLGHIPNAINIPGNYLYINPENYIDKNKKYYLYCSCGSRSRKLCIELNRQGYHTIDLMGGYERYLSNQ